MLLPSAIPCDSSQHAAGQPMLQQPIGSHFAASPALFVSPPASPPTLSSQNALANIMTTCRSLQSLLASPPPIVPESRPFSQLPTPPLTHAPPPLKLRLRSRGKMDLRDDPLAPRKRITKRTPPRGTNKRRRAVDDGSSDLDCLTDSDLELDSPSRAQPDAQPKAPSTPKRARIAPEQLPLGLGRSDFHDMNLRSSSANGSNNGHSIRHVYGQSSNVEAEEEDNGDEWSAEDDRILVELVLEKLKLSKTEWQDCARNLGRDRHSVGRRWKSLVMGGDVGLKAHTRRRTLHSTWR